MAPSAMDIDAPEPPTIPPPKLYAPREAYFEQFVHPQNDGYVKARSRGNDGAAIVIDNGTKPLPIQISK